MLFSTQLKHLFRAICHKHNKDFKVFLFTLKQAMGLDNVYDLSLVFKFWMFKGIALSDMMIDCAACYKRGHLIF